MFAGRVTTAEAVQEIALGPDGALAAMRPGPVFLDHMTVSAEHVDLMRKACTTAGVLNCEHPLPNAAAQWAPTT